MDYISAKEAAEKWGITVRWVQQCCNKGLIPGAGRLGNSWIIPQNAIKPNPKTTSGWQSTQCMPLLNRSFLPGNCKNTIEDIPDLDEQNIAWGEYYYFTGQAEKVLDVVMPYLTHENVLFRISAGILYGYANLTLQNKEEARRGLVVIQSAVAALQDEDADPRLQAIGVCIQVMSAVLLHLPIPEGLHLEEELKYLPRGLKLFACYVLAHQEYLDGDYWESVGMAELALSISDQSFPISSIYLHLVAAMSLMRAKHTDKAREHFQAAWEIAKPDDLIQAFGEHHGLLCGLVETCLRWDYPEGYDRVIDIVYRFSEGWRRIHNPDTQHQVAGNLSTTEFTIATMASHGWSNQEIARFLNLSVHTVKNYISIIYQKLNISSRKELEQYMLR